MQPWAEAGLQRQVRRLMKQSGCRVKSVKKLVRVTQRKGGRFTFTVLRAVPNPATLWLGVSCPRGEGVTPAWEQQKYLPCRCKQMGEHGIFGNQIYVCFLFYSLWGFFFHKKYNLGVFQDGGGVGGRGVHLSPQTHQEYIYKWNSSHRAPVER